METNRFVMSFDLLELCPQNIFMLELCIFEFELCISMFKPCFLNIQVMSK